MARTFVRLMEIPGRVDQVDQVSAILFRVWRFDEIAIHETSKDPLTYRPPARGSKGIRAPYTCV